MRNTLIEIRTAALAHNLRRVRQMAPHSRVLSMVKADAYGHGVAAALRGLTGSDAFGVACWSEAQAVRAWTDRPIVLIEGAFDLAEWQQAAQLGAMCVVHQPRQLQWALAHPAPDRPVWLKINTGMNRLGFAPHAAIAAGQQLQQAGYQLVLTQHFANADVPDHPMNAQQVQAFAAVQAALQPRHTSQCNSAALLTRTDLHGDWVRPGIMLYGSSPFADQSAQDLGLRPAMHVCAPLLAVHDVPAGATVGYGARWVAATGSRIGVVAIGYGDGYPRVVTGACAQIGDHRVPVIGRVSMDMLMVDLSGCGEAPALGTPVTLWGDGPSVDEVAQASGTIGYELLCRMTQRPTRTVI